MERPPDRRHRPTPPWPRRASGRRNSTRSPLHSVGIHQRELGGGHRRARVGVEDDVDVGGAQRHRHGAQRGSVRGSPGQLGRGSLPTDSRQSPALTAGGTGMFGTTPTKRLLFASVSTSTSSSASPTAVVMPMASVSRAAGLVFAAARWIASTKVCRASVRRGGPAWRRPALACQRACAPPCQRDRSAYHQRRAPACHRG